MVDSPGRQRHIKIDGLWLPVLVMQAPSVTKTFYQGMQLVPLVEQGSFFGVKSHPHPPISCISSPSLVIINIRR